MKSKENESQEQRRKGDIQSRALVEGPPGKQASKMVYISKIKGKTGRVIAKEAFK